MLSPEQQLFLQCAKIQTSPDDYTEIDNLIKNYHIDWSTLLNLSILFKVPEIISYNLAGFDVPEEPLTSLLNSRVRTELINNTLFQETLELTRMFEESNLKVLCFKGITLTKTLYPSICLRRSVDIDFFYLPNEENKAFEVLKKRGYHQNTKFIAGEMGFAKKIGDIQFDVEMHSKHVPYLFEDIFFDFFDRAKKRNIDDTDIWCLDDTDELLALFLYVIATKNPSSFKYLNDFDLLLSQRNIDWGRIATGPASRTNIYLVLYLLEQLFSRDLRTIETFMPNKLLRNVFERLFSQESVFKEKNIPEKILRFILLRTNTPHAFRYITHDLLLNVEYLFRRI